MIFVPVFTLLAVVFVRLIWMATKLTGRDRREAIAICVVGLLCSLFGAFRVLHRSGYL